MVSATINMFFAVTGCEEYEEGTLYCSTKTDIKADRNVDLVKYAEKRIKCLSEVYGVPEENIKVISRKEYKENTGVGMKW